MLDRDAWKRVLVRLEEAGVRKNLASDPFADDLYTLVDSNGDGFVDKSELLSGLSLTCKGTPQQKMDLMFQLWDANGDGRLDQEELTKCFHKCYRSACLILLRKNPKAESLTKVERLENGKSKTESSFCRRKYTRLPTSLLPVLPFKCRNRFLIKWTKTATDTLIDQSFPPFLLAAASKSPLKWKDKNFQDTWFEKKGKKDECVLTKRAKGFFSVEEGGK